MSRGYADFVLLDRKANRVILEVRYSMRLWDVLLILAYFHVDADLVGFENGVPFVTYFNGKVVRYAEV